MPKNSNNLKLLVVDDDCMIRGMLSEILTEEGYDVDTASDGKMALAKMSDNPPELVLSDMNMPIMGGLELIKGMGNAGHDYPVVVLSGNNEISVALEAIKNGASDYLLKDENIQENITMGVRRALEKKHILEEKHKAEEKVKKQNKILAAQNEELKELNETKNKFLGIAAHDLRNPLYVINSYCEILDDPKYSPITEKQKDLLAKMLKAGKFMASLLDNLLDVSKIESGKIELDRVNQDFNEITRYQVQINQLLANKKEIKLHLELGDISQVYCDEKAMMQVIANYIGNAIKFSPLKSNIFISTKNLGNKVLFSVRDEGPGISEENQKLLFGEFTTVGTKTTGGEKSTGLGLAIAKKIVNLHEGIVGVKSQTGEGATFYFKIPFN